MPVIKQKMDVNKFSWTPTGQIRRRKMHRGKKDALSFSVILFKPLLCAIKFLSRTWIISSTAAFSANYLTRSNAYIMHFHAHQFYSRRRESRMSSLINAVWYSSEQEIWFSSTWKTQWCRRYSIQNYVEFSFRLFSRFYSRSKSCASVYCASDRRELKM